MSSYFLSNFINNNGLYKYRVFSRYVGIEVGKELEVFGSNNINLSYGVSIGQRVLLDAESYGKGKLSIGGGSEIHDYCQLKCFGGEIKIGDSCSVNPFCILYGHGGLTIGDNTRIATHCVIIPANHTFNSKDKLISEQKESRKGVIIGDDVWIGANCVILDGVTIGSGTVIGAGSVVTKSIEPYSVVSGVPAKLMRTR